jgi:inorganic pyrophosphatase
MPTKSGSFEVEVVIETPKRSRNKYAWDPRRKAFTLSRVLPAGMSFPYDFGFVPGTRADDGDPFDVLVLMDEPAFPGCVVNCRVIGVIEGEQLDEGAKRPVRNDRLVAVEHENHIYAGARTITDLPEQLLHEVAEFFVNYHRLQHRRFRILGTHGPQRAQDLVRRSRRAA